MGSLVQKQMRLLRERIKGQKFEINFSKEAIDHLADIGYDETYGARPLQSTFTKLVIRPLSKMILTGKLEGKKVFIDLVGDQLEAKVS
jgi:ATP-dependent Clp protease ATP-binding subunit ClpB